MSKPESKIFNDFMKLDLKSIDINTLCVYKELCEDERHGIKLSDKEFEEKLVYKTVVLMRAKLKVRKLINK